MKARWLTVSFAALVAALALACSGSSKSAVSSFAGDTRRDRVRGATDLTRDLEATVLENYGQLTLGNVSAYTDNIARDGEVALLGIGPRNLVIKSGDDASIASWDPRPFSKREVSLLSRNLEIHLSRDNSMGWVFDELSLRVPHAEREAAVPLRYTALFVRDIDRWALVMEHTSYAISAPQLRQMAASKALRKPAAIPRRRGLDRVARLIESYVRDILANNASAITRRHTRQRRRGRLTDAERARLGIRLFLLPGMYNEHHGADAMAAPPLASLFGDGVSLALESSRVHLSGNKDIAWMIANLSVQIPGQKGPVEIGLRGTFVLELMTNGWELVQAHVSAPVTQKQLRERVLGEPP
jgi:ketosteroid isomerase-like protein